MMFFLEIKDKQVRRLDFTTSKDVPLANIRGKQQFPYYSLAYNPAESAVILVTRTPPSNENSNYDLFVVPREATESSTPPDVSDFKRGSANSAVWVARNR